MDVVVRDFENPNEEQGSCKTRVPQRYGQIIGLKREAHEKYVEHHAQVWPGVLKTIHDCNIRNYSIYFKDDMLFACFEYVGNNFRADMAKIAADPTTQAWWAIMTSVITQNRPYMIP